MAYNARRRVFECILSFNIDKLWFNYIVYTGRITGIDLTL
jgi:hypothetical protein